VIFFIGCPKVLDHLLKFEVIEFIIPM